MQQELQSPTEFPDSRLKYIEMPSQFQGMAGETAMTCRQHLRTCEALAKRLAGENPKTKQEFEKIEFYKDFVIKTAEMNERILKVLDYVRDLLNAIVVDSLLLEEARMKDTLRMQSETLEYLYQQNDDLVKSLHDQLRKNKENPK